MQTSQTLVSGDAHTSDTGGWTQYTHPHQCCIKLRCVILIFVLDMYLTLLTLVLCKMVSKHVQRLLLKYTKLFHKGVGTVVLAPGVAMMSVSDEQCDFCMFCSHLLVTSGSDGV